jgi:hypothetical protein
MFLKLAVWSNPIVHSASRRYINREVDGTRASTASVIEQFYVACRKLKARAKRQAFMTI